MRKYLIERHFVNSEATLAEYAAGVERLKAAVDISRANGYGFDFGMKITVDEKKVPHEVVESVKEVTRQLPSGLWVLYDPEDRGAGTSYRQILFNPTFDDGIVISPDLDQFEIETEEALEKLKEFAEKSERDQALYGVSSKDVPIILATNPRNSDLRIIHELFHSLAVGSDRLRIEEKPEGVTPAFAEIGESISGVRSIDHLHPMYPELVRSISQASQIANMRGFATDYYIAVKAPQLAPVATGYAKSKPNKFYEKRDEAIELASVTRMISGQTAELGKTDVKDTLLRAVESEESVRRLSEFYSVENVLFVRDLMRDALRSAPEGEAES